MDSPIELAVENEKDDHHARQVEFKIMIENFVYQRNDKGRTLLSKLKSYIHNCSYKHKHFPLSAEDQEEVIQEIAIKVLKNYNKIHENYYGWLFKVAHNEYFEKLRKVIPNNNLIEVYSGNELIIISDKVNGGISSIDTVDFLDCFEEVFKRATTMDSRDADRLLYERYVEGFTHDEMASQLNKPSSFVAKRISSLNQSIREFFVTIC